MNYTALDDKTLILLIARADAQALSALYDRYHRLIFSLALNVVGDHGTAEEITLDVFIRVWRAARTYRGEQAKVTTWLASITRNRSIDVIRKRNVRPEQHSVGWAEIAHSGVPRVNGPETATELSLQRQRVRAAIGELPPEQKQVLALAYFQGYTHREIAEVLDTPLGTVKTRIRLAMGKLRDMLEEESITI